MRSSRPLFACIALLAILSFVHAQQAFDLLAHPNAKSLPSCGKSLDGKYYRVEDANCAALLASLAQVSLPKDSQDQYPRLSTDERNIYVLPHLEQADDRTLTLGKTLVHNLVILLAIPQSKYNPSTISFTLEETLIQDSVTCSSDVGREIQMDQFRRLSCSSTSGIIPLINISVRRIAFLTSPTPYELVQVVLSDESERWVLSRLPSSSSSLTSYAISMVGFPYVSFTAEASTSNIRAILSVQSSENSNDDSSIVWQLIVPIIGASFVIVAAITMVVTKRKSSISVGGGNGGSSVRSPTPPKGGSVSPVAGNSPSSLGDGNVLASAGGHATSSTMATSTSYSPTGPMGGGGGGVISSSISPGAKSGFSGSPHGEIAFQHNVSGGNYSALSSARSGIISPGRREQSSLSPQTSPATPKASASAHSAVAAGGNVATAIGGAGVVSCATNQSVAQSNNAGATGFKSTGLGAFMFSKKKTSKRTLLEPLVSPKPRSWAPAVVANTYLASLPNEAVPKPKPRYLVSAQASNKTSNAKRPVRYQDFVPSTSQNKYGTYSRIHSKRALSSSRASTGELDDDESLDSTFGSSNLKHGNEGKTIAVIGGPDQVLGDEDGSAGLFLAEDDDWLDDIVEPDSDDPIYKNDTHYTHIDVDTLMPVDDALIDASVELIENHLSAIASPLSLAIPTELPTIEEDESKKKKKKKKTSSSKLPKLLIPSEGPAMAGTHSTSPSAAAINDTSASPTSPSPPIAASGMSPFQENVSISAVSPRASTRPPPNTHHIPAPATWRPSRNTAQEDIPTIVNSKSAEDLTTLTVSASPSPRPEGEVKVKSPKKKSREKDNTETSSNDSSSSTKKRSKKKTSERIAAAGLEEIPEEETPPQSTASRGKKQKKDKKEKTKRKRREKEEADE